MNAVIKKSDGYYVTTTFMDGTNGVYRYDYSQEGVGLQGYDVSYRLLQGWWIFLRDDRVTNMYEEILNMFPINDVKETPYFDPVTIQEQNIYFDQDTSFENGFMEIIIMLAVRSEGR